ncbi:tetratricopeptide repeat protein [Kitasatospora sp. KL5]|uniref:tetratricopeptide repeat protein n=1 Tax=Kitasatospora sp. KL5 TaxID=3425125 RepID=UPI003D6E23EC
MNVDDLVWQVTHYGGIPPRLVDRLVGLGRLDLVIRAAAEREEWFCAEAAVRALCGAGELERAWALIEPFAATGWRPAVRVAAEILLRQGRTEEALALLHPGEAAREGRDWRDYALMLAEAGRVDEAIEVLTPHLEDWWLLETLVEMTEGQGRDERVLGLITPLAERVRQATGERRWQCSDLWKALDLQAQVLERAGRAEEAIRILGADVAADRHLVQNTVAFYAELLARHGRIEELRALGTGDQAAVALEHYAKALEERGRAQEAEAVLRGFIDTTGHGGHRATLIGLLGRQGRIDEAVEVGRPTFEYYDCGNHLDWIVRLLVEDERPERALELLEGCSEEYVREHAWWVRPTRLWLLGEAGRCQEALAEAAALPGEPGDWDIPIAFLLAQTGRVDDAVDLLRSSPALRATSELAELLIEHGRPAEAVAVFPTVSAQRKKAQRRSEAAHRDPALEPPI